MAIRHSTPNQALILHSETQSMHFSTNLTSEEGGMETPEGAPGRDPIESCLRATHYAIRKRNYALTNVSSRWRMAHFGPHRAGPSMDIWLPSQPHPRPGKSTMTYCHNPSLHQPMQLPIMPWEDGTLWPTIASRSTRIAQDPWSLTLGS